MTSKRRVLSAASALPTTRRVRDVARLLALALLMLACGALLLPWQQSVRGKGRVMALSPVERPQVIEAPIDARVLSVLVQEGQHVRAGDVLIDLQDVDAQREQRLVAEQQLAVLREQTSQARVEALSKRRDAVVLTQDSALLTAKARADEAQQRVSVAQQAVMAADAELEAAVLQLDRQRKLVEKGLVASRDVELAVAGEQRARTTRDGASAQVAAAQAALAAANAAVAQAQAARDAERASADAAVQAAEGDVQNAQATRVRSDGAVSRQQTQRVTAPRDGIVQRLFVFAGGEWVKTGDTLLILVPDAQERAVELLIDGNDAALVQPGRLVRIQFEGWPAVQFVGWPQAAVGTFAGVVRLVDASDTNNGDFRIIVVPDASSAPWPPSTLLRQGVRAQAFVLLDNVSLGFELWRQFNGFPPNFPKDALPPLDGKRSSDKKSGATP